MVAGPTDALAFTRRNQQEPSPNAYRRASAATTLAGQMNRGEQLL